MLGREEYGYCTEWYVTKCVCRPAFISFRWRIGDEQPYSRAHMERDGYVFDNSHSFEGGLVEHVFRAKDEGGVLVEAETPEQAWAIYDKEVR